MRKSVFGLAFAVVFLMSASLVYAQDICENVKDHYVGECLELGPDPDCEKWRETE